jgi:2-keto-4-pentenoate hydratase
MWALLRTVCFLEVVRVTLSGFSRVFTDFISTRRKILGKVTGEHPQRPMRLYFHTNHELALHPYRRLPLLEGSE